MNELQTAVIKELRRRNEAGLIGRLRFSNGKHPNTTPCCVMGHIWDIEFKLGIPQIIDLVFPRVVTWKLLDANDAESPEVAINLLEASTQS